MEYTHDSEEMPTTMPPESEEHFEVHRSASRDPENISDICSDLRDESDPFAVAELAQRGC
jgi:hypothetical protein